MPGFSESSTVQRAIVERLVTLGWTYVPGKDLARTSDEVFLEEDVNNALLRLNPLIGEQPGRLDEVVPKLRAVALSAINDGVVPANERMTTWLRGHQTMKFVGTDDYVPVKLLDLDHPAGNRLVVSDEVTFGTPGNSRRFDIVLWVNGLPLVVGETKTPVDSHKSWLNGARDIHDIYEPDAPSFFATNVLSFATEGREFHYGAVGQPAEHSTPARLAVSALPGYCSLRVPCVLYVRLAGAGGYGCGPRVAAGLARGSTGRGAMPRG